MADTKIELVVDSVKPLLQIKPTIQGIRHADPSVQQCCFNVTTGGFSVLLKGLPGAQLGVHYHVGTVRGYTLQGHWRYLEHDWLAKPGTFIYEPAGEAHTLVVTEDSPEAALIMFIVEGGPR